MKRAVFLPVFVLLLAACSVPVDVPPSPTVLPPTLPPQPTQTLSSEFAPISKLTPDPAAQVTPTIPAGAAPADFCQDPRVLDLITSLGKAAADKDGKLLASLVSASQGMDVRFLRDGNTVNYDAEHAQFVFETTFQAEWGAAPGSGEPLMGSFQAVVLPSLQTVFKPDALLKCNQIQLGGATYAAEWTYEDLEYYSVHFPGTTANGNLDWQTWAVGMDFSSGKPAIAALVHYFWEP